MVSNNSHPIFTEVANGQIEKGWGTTKHRQKMDLGTKQSKASKGPSVHKCPISLSSRTALSYALLAYLAHNNMRNLPSKSLHFLPKNDFPRESRKGHQTFKSFSCKWWSAAWSSILFSFIGNFFNFLPSPLCTTLTQNWNEHANAQLITNVCLPLQLLFFRVAFSFWDSPAFGVYFVFCNLIDLLMTWWLIYQM